MPESRGQSSGRGSGGLSSTVSEIRGDEVEDVQEGRLEVYEVVSLPASRV